MNNKNIKKRKLHEVSGAPLPERPVITKRRNLATWGLITYFEARVEEGTKKREVKQRARDRIGLRLNDSPSSACASQALGLKVRRRHSTEVQALLVFLRFGSLNIDAKVWLTLSEIFKRTGVKPASQLKIYARWKRRGFVIFDEKPKGRKKTLTSEQIEWLVSRETLESMTHLSLRKRLPLVQ